MGLLGIDVEQCHFPRQVKRRRKCRVRNQHLGSAVGQLVLQALDRKIGIQRQKGSPCPVNSDYGLKQNRAALCAHTDNGSRLNTHLHKTMRNLIGPRIQFAIAGGQARTAQCRPLW